MLNKELFLLLNAFLTGGLIKLYDDIKDNNIINDFDEENSCKMKILKIIVTVSVFVISILDPTFLFISIFVIIPLCTYVGQINIDFWKTLVLVSCAAFILNYETIINSVTKDKILLLLCTGILIIVESKLYPEEKSDRKTTFRIFFTVLGILSIYFAKGTSYEFIRVFMSFCVGYGVSNLLFQKFYLDTHNETESAMTSL